MPELIMAYWPYLLIAFAIGLAVSWFVLVASRRAKVVIDRRDVLDEGAARAQRNQALINAGRGHAEPAVADLTGAPATGGDDLTRIKGLGPKIAAILHAQGVTTYRQIAAWDQAEVARIDALLGRFSGRIGRDAWVEQAQMLAAGDETGFSAKFGREG
ncbi:MAG: hypothetical protein APF82_01550 [Sphingomonadales bacterium BRH_c42]|nr:MAG: hypothetical protein APF82_01550 [Sphingomonadales bacterium BRH_c42]